MVVAGQGASVESGVDALTPVCDEAEFAELVAEMVADEAPRLFAVVQEFGERVDGQVAAWGMAFDDGVEIVAADGSRRMSLRSTERALQLFGRRAGISARLVWVHDV